MKMTTTKKIAFTENESNFIRKISTSLGDFDFPFNINVRTILTSFFECMCPELDKYDISIIFSELENDNTLSAKEITIILYQ